MDRREEVPLEPGAGRALTVLHRFARREVPVRTAAPAATESCELCAEPLPADHRHLMEIAPSETGHAVRCVCRACTLLFNRDVQGGRYRLIPDRRLLLRDFAIDDTQWQALQVPVGLAFIGYRTASGKTVASYPGAVGAVEAEIDPASWEKLQKGHPVLGTLEPDVEALLIHRVRDARGYFVAPIDDCYRLAGLVRSHWRGLTGGTRVWEEVGRFFEELERRSREVGPQTARWSGPGEVDELENRCTRK